MKKRFGIFILALAVLLLPLLMLAAVSTETGSRWLLNALFSSLHTPQLSATRIDGKIAGNLSLTGLSYQSGQDKVKIENLVFDWQPSQLLYGTLQIRNVAAAGLVIELNEASQEEKKPPSLDSDLSLPLPIDIQNLLLENVTFHRHNSHLLIDRFQLSLRADNDLLKIRALSTSSPQWTTNITGTIALAKPFDLNLNATWRADAGANGIWQGKSALTGDIIQLTFNNQINSPFLANLQGHVDDVLNAPKIQANVNWQNLTWPFAHRPPEFNSPSGQLEVSGLLSDYRVVMSAELDQARLPKNKLSFEAKGDLEMIAIHQLELKSVAGLLNMAGQVSWKQGTTFDLSATGDQFNPAILVPELPGNLKIDSRVQGQLDENHLQITANINKIAGNLRKQPVHASGALAYDSEKLTIQQFNIFFGANKLFANGALGAQGKKLEVELQMPALGAFWPSLDGKLTGKGSAEDPITKPSAQLDLQGNGLKFGAAKLKSLSVSARYFPGNQKNSSLKFLANGLEQGNLSVSKLSLDGSGNEAQHQLIAELISPGLTVSTGLDGSYTNSGWRGKIGELAMTDANGRLWSLQNKVAVQITQKPEGFDIETEKFCLSHRDAFLCSQCFYRANGDFKVMAEAKALPANLFEPLMADKLSISSQIDANLNLQRKNNNLNGRYTLNLSPAEIVLTANHAKRSLNLGASSLAGNIQDNRVASDLHLGLTGKDYVRSDFILDTEGSKALSGRLAASVDDFSFIQPFVTAASGLKGHLQADFGFQGTLDRPIIAGNLDLIGGEADFGVPASTKTGLRQLMIHASASANRANSVKLSASAIPVVINQTGSTNPYDVKTHLDLVADLTWAPQLTGNFKLSTPATTTVSVQTQTGAQKLNFGASSLTGRWLANKIQTELDLALTGQDFVRGRLETEMNGDQNLAGQIRASIRDLKTVETLVPQLSNIKGNISADAIISGTRQNPLVNGELLLRDAAADIDELGLAIRDINLKATAPPDNPTLVRLTGSAKSGQGILNLNGKLELDPALQYPTELKLTGTNAEVVKLPEAEILVSPDLGIILNNTQKRITGSIEIPKASIQLNELPENAVKVSEDEIVLGEEKPENEAINAPGMDVDVEIKMGKDIHFKGLGLQTGLAGKVRAVKSDTQLTLQGNIDMEKGSYKRFGQNLTLRKGRFLFNGPADNPWLDVEATRLSKDQKVTAILNLSGTLKNPQTHISSEPALPEAEALAYLVTGNPLNQVSKAENNLLASAALSYGAGQATWLAEKLGINEFDVVEGSTLKDTLLVMGQYLTPDFYVGTKIGMFSKQAILVLKHKITDTVNVETQTGTSQRIKLNYEFDSD